MIAPRKYYKCEKNLVLLFEMILFQATHSDSTTDLVAYADSWSEYRDEITVNLHDMIWNFLNHDSVEKMFPTVI